MNVLLVLSYQPQTNDDRPTENDGQLTMQQTRRTKTQ